MADASGAVRLREAWRKILAEPSSSLAGLLVVALAVGAGGVAAALGNLAVQLTALAMLAVNLRSVRWFVPKAPRALVLLVIASCLLPLLQLVPLPPAVWLRMPGRELVAQSLALAGGSGWFPLSVHPARTLVAFLGTLAPLSTIAIGVGLQPSRMVWLQRVVIGLALVVAGFGATHLVNPQWGDLYAEWRELPGVLVGTFADRNAAALFFGAGLLLLIGLPDRPSGPTSLALRVAAGVALALAVVLTRSRTGIALLALPAALAAVRIASAWFGQRREPARTAGLTLGISLVVVLMGVLALTTGRVQQSLDRFDEGDGMRKEMREDARYAAARYWPVGAGMGTFDEVFQIDESLEYLSPRRAGRAHMDYLELAIEAGAVGLALAAGWLVWIAAGAWRAWRQPRAWPARAASLILVAIAAQSVLSFPLRNQAMLCVAALAIVLIARSPSLAPIEPDRQQ